jgi:hypothetical protein
MVSRAFPGLLPAFVILSLTTALPARAAPANTLRELFDQIGQCLKKAPGAPVGEITVFYSLRQDGSLFGKPRITYLRASNDDAEKSRFVESVAAAFGACFPTQITPKLGMAIAGRPLNIRISVKGRETDI